MPIGHAGFVFPCVSQADIVDFSGRFNWYSKETGSFDYESVDAVVFDSGYTGSVYMSAESGGCGDWFMTPSKPFPSWDVGSVYYVLSAPPGSRSDYNW